MQSMMKTELSAFIHKAAVCDTHEHILKEEEYLGEKPDILRELFRNYIQGDLVVAGADPAAVASLLDASNPDIERRFIPIKRAWEQAQLTGYGEAVRLIASRFFHIDVIDEATLAAAQAKLPERWPAGERLRILRDEGGLDHIQADDFLWPCVPDLSGPDFFLNDISWLNFCNGNVHADKLLVETGVEVKNLETLREAMAALFKKYAACAIAVKTQHAYNRTLFWRERTDSEAAEALKVALRDPPDNRPPQSTLRDLNARPNETKNCLGDWCLARGVELSIEHNLPFKIHTGSYSSYGWLPVEYIRPGHLCGLLKAYPKARFVLMHIGWPYDNELIALAKHYPNMWTDLCWAWSLNPRASANFVRHFIHAVPSNKLFGFGGDTFFPRATVAYAMQMRRWLTSALQAEVDEGCLSESQAIRLAQRMLQHNQRECFDVGGVRMRIRTQSGPAAR